MKYAGVGSRSTPPDYLKTIHRLAVWLSGAWVLRSGRAPGADLAFEEGCRQGGGLKEIFLPWPRFGNDIAPGFMGSELLESPSIKAYLMAEELLGPAHWVRLTRGGRSLHSRNMHQVLGKDLDDPVDMVIYWSPVDDKNEPIGGTKTAWRVAKDHQIPSFNLGISRQQCELVEFFHVVCGEADYSFLTEKPLFR